MLVKIKEKINLSNKKSNKVQSEGVITLKSIHNDQEVGESKFDKSLFLLLHIEKIESFPPTLNSDSHRKQLYPRVGSQFQENINIVKETKLLNLYGYLISKPLFFAAKENPTCNSFFSSLKLKKQNSKNLYFAPWTASPKRLDWSLRLKETVEFAETKSKEKTIPAILFSIPQILETKRRKYQ